MFTSKLSSKAHQHNTADIFLCVKNSDPLISQPEMLIIVYDLTEDFNLMIKPRYS